MPGVKGRFSPVGPRFWRKVQKTDGCWLWIGSGSKTEGSYGGISIAKKRYQAHRVSYELHYGPIPDGKHVCHHCDNRKCVRPDHLFLGTRSDNMRDAKAKGRLNFQINPSLMARGSRCRRGVLSEAIVEEIRARVRDGETYTAIAQSLKCNRGTVTQAARGFRWAHVAAAPAASSHWHAKPL